jgi:porphobilinogen synthase
MTIHTPPDLSFRTKITHRPRRNRSHPAIRALVSETKLHASDFVAPLFLLDGKGRKETIDSMPGVYRLSIDLTLKKCERLLSLGVQTIDLFPVIQSNQKDPIGSESHNPNGLLQRAVRSIKKEFPELWVMTDIALDPFSNHGHDGLVDERGCVVNDPTLEALGKMVLSCAEAGCDMVAPSDMMDGRVGYFRHLLDDHNFEEVGILAYSAKYASSFYGPFREALNSAPKFGDKKSYQMDPSNVKEALLEATLDLAEGADLLMVKPALPYLDVISKLSEATDLPIGGYQVSGEYSMIQAAAQRGWIDGDRVLLESLLGIKRAGASFIFTYGCEQVAALL